MAYTVKKLAQISGVSVRTLHHYDEVDLLKPAYFGSNGYRYYEEEQLLLLQQILFYRELGFELKQIQKLLKKSDFDKLAALHSHRKLLKGESERFEKLVVTIDKTIDHLKGKIKMKDEEFFYGLDSPKQKGYEEYLIKTGRVSEEEINKSRETVKNWQKEDHDKFKKYQEEGDRRFKAMAKSIDDHLLPGSPEVQKLIRELYNWIGLCWGTAPTKERFIGLSQLYNEHPDWAKMYGRYHPKLQEFLTEAMIIFAERELS